MGFSKVTNAKEVSIVVTHPMHAGDRYVFTFSKLLPQAALDAQGRFLGLPDTARAEEWRTALVATVAEMVIREPEGFDDFPGAEQLLRVAELNAQLDAPAGSRPKAFEPDAARAEIEARERELADIRRRPLAERMRVYFDDPEQPELEAIIVQAWKEYKAAAVPAAYVKSPEDSDAPSGESSGVPATAPSVV